MDTSNDSTDAANAEGGGSDQTHAGLSPSRELLRNPLSRSPIGSTAEKTTPPPTKDGGEEKREQVPHEDGERSGESFDEEENKVEMEDEPGHTSAELQRAEETKNPDDGIIKPEVEGEEERDEECIVDHTPDSSTAEDTGGEKVVAPNEAVEQEEEEAGTALKPGLCKSHEEDPSEDPSGEGYPMEVENECRRKEEGCTGETVGLQTEETTRESDNSAESQTQGFAGEEGAEAVTEDKQEDVTTQEEEDELESTTDEAQGGHSPGKTPSGEDQTEAGPTDAEKDSKPFNVPVNLPGEMAVAPSGPVSSSSVSPPSLTTLSSPPQVTSSSVVSDSSSTSTHSPPPDPITDSSSLHSPTPHPPSLTSPPSLASPPPSNIDSAPPSLPLATLQSPTDTVLPRPTSTPPPHATSHPSPLSPSSQIPTITPLQLHSPKVTPTSLNEPTVNPPTVTTLPEPPSTTIESPQLSLTLASSTPLPTPSDPTSSNASKVIRTLQTGQTLTHIHSTTPGDTIITDGRSISTDSSIGKEEVERVGGLEETTEQERGEDANESMKNDVEMVGETNGVAGTEEGGRVGGEEEEGMDVEVGEEENRKTDAVVLQSPHETTAPEDTGRGEEDMEVDGHAETDLASSSSVEDKNAESMCGPKDTAEVAGEDNSTITDDSHYEGAEDDSRVIGDSQSESLSAVTPVQGEEVSDVETGPVEEEQVDDSSAVPLGLQPPVGGVTIDDSSAGPLGLQPPVGDVTVDDVENDNQNKVDSVDGASSPASSIEQENDEQEKDKAGGSEERDNEDKPAVGGTLSATPPQSSLDSGPSIANPGQTPEKAPETPVEDVGEDGASHAESDTQTVEAQSSTGTVNPVQSSRQSSGERVSVRTLRRRASDSSSPSQVSSHGVSPPVRLRRKSSDVPCPQSGTADTVSLPVSEAEANPEPTQTPPSTVFPSISTALAETNPSTKPSLTVFGSQVHQTPPAGPETTPTPQVQSSVEPSSSPQGSKAQLQLVPTHAVSSTSNTVGTGAQKPTDTTPAVVVSTAKTTVHVSPSISTSLSPSVSAAPPAPTATAPQLPPGYQPVIQVTPSGPVVTLIHTSQLKLASLQLSQQAAAAALAAVAENKKAGAIIPPSPAGPTGKAVTSKFESPEKRPVLTGGRPETLQRGSGTSPLTSVQRIAVPKPQTFESMQAVRIHPEQRDLPEVAGVGSQTEPTTAGGGGEGASSSQSDTPQSSQLKIPIAAVSSLSSPLLLSRSQVNHEANSEKVSPQQLSAPVAHVPVVQRAGLEERAEGGGRKEAESEGTEGNRVDGVKIAEKLMVQKAEILGSFGTSGREDFQPKHISTIQCHTGSSSTTTGTKSPQVAVIPPLVDLTKVTSDSDNGKKDDKSKESSSEKQPVIRRFWTTSWTPLNVNDLEFIGSDSKGNLYWYDGGRNMFLSPPHPDHRHKPREADMQLVCKSMVQWTTKLKELRNTKDEQDMKLSHVIKEKFAPRVRRVTQRKPKRDQTALIQLINSSKNQQQQQQQPSVQQQTQQQQQVQQAFQQHLQMLQQQQHLQQVAVASTSASSSSASSSSSSSSSLQAAANSTAVVMQSADGTAQKRSVQVQSSFPQGSILVVPHQHGGFQAVPFLPVFANTAVIMPQGVAATATSGSPQPATQTPSKAENASVAGSSNRAKVDVDRETGKRNPTVDGVREGKLGGDEKSDQLAGKVEGKKKEKERVSQPGLMNPPVAPGLFVPVYAMKTGELVKLESFDFRSKSVEISGEVPIRAVQVGESGEEDTIPLSRLRELVGDSFSETAGGGKAKEVPPPLGQEVLKSHTSTEVMSAKMLLSLTGSSEVSPLEKDPPKTAGATPTSEGGATGTGEQPVAATTPSSSGTPNSVGRQTPSGSKGARKRKQKPTPSAKPSTSDETKPKEQAKDGKSATAARGKSDKTAPPAKKRARKTTAKSAAMAADDKNSPQVEKTKGPARPKKGSQKNSKASGGDTVSSASPASLTKEKGPSGKSRMKTASASVRMEQLKAERGSRPVKEFVIESSSGSDSEESDSSSGTGSTSFSPNSGSSSDSSSDSSSENQQSGEAKPSPLKTAVGGRGRGGGGGGVRGRGGRGGRGGGAKRKGGPAAGKGRGVPKSQSSSSEESSGGEEEEEGKEEAKRQKAEPGQQRGKAGAGKGSGRSQVTRGRGRRKKGGDPGHIVSIPTDLLESLPPKKRQRKAEQTTDHDSERLARIRGDYLPEGGNLSSFYSAVEVDLSTLSELTESVPGKDPSRGDGTRSKRTCVRVREGISRLEEILGNGGSTSSPPTRSTRGRGRGVGSGVSSGGDSTKRQRRTAYRSQFTQKRRRKRRKPEDEALWQPAHKSTATENRRPIYVFSTDMANAAADAVLKNRYDSIIQFHNAQPKGPGFLRPSTNDTGRRDDTNNSNDVTRDSSESDDEGEGGGARGGGSGGGGGRGGGGGGVVRGVNEVNKAPKRRSSRLSTSEDTPTAKRLRGGGQARRGSDNSKQTRYSRRLRKRQQASSSPPSSPAESANQSSSEEDESGAESGGSPAPLPVTQRRGGRSGGRGARSRGRGRGGRGRGRRNVSLANNSSGRRGPAGNVDEKDTEDEEEVEGEESEKQAGEGEMDTSRNTDQQETPEDKGDKSNEPQFERRMGNPYGVEKVAAGSPHLTSQRPSLQGGDKEENNYTICHGTPRSKGSRAVDVSSPAPHDHLSPQRLVGGSPALATPVSSVAAHHTQHDIASLGVLPDKHQQSSTMVGLSSGGAAGRGDPMLGATSALHPNSGGATHHHHKEPAMAPNNWPGGLGPQFAHVPGGYYGAGIHPMHYPPHHAAQHVPGANYSYGVYPWGTPHAVGGHPPRDQQTGHLYGHEGGPQHRQTPSSHASHHPSQPGSSGSGHFQLHPTTHRSAADMGKDSTGGSSASGASPSQGGHEPAHDKQHPHSSPNHPPHHSLRQLPGSAGVMTTLPHVQHPSAPAYPRPHPALAPDQISTMHPAAAFSYGFDPSNPAALSHMHQLWQQQQQQMRAAGAVHPTHLPPHLQHPAAAGMWYPHMQQLIQHGGGIPPDDSAKRRGVAAASQQGSGGAKHPPSSDGLRTNSNRNNNEPALISRPSPEALLHGTRFPYNKPLPSFQQTLSSLIADCVSRGELNITSTSRESNAHPSDSYP